MSCFLLCWGPQDYLLPISTSGAQETEVFSLGSGNMAGGITVPHADAHADMASVSDLVSLQRWPPGVAFHVCANWCVHMHIYIAVHMCLCVCGWVCCHSGTWNENNRNSWTSTVSLNGSGVQSHPWLHRELEGSLRYLRSYLTKPKPQ